MSFLIPAAIATTGAILGGIAKKKQASKESQYEYDLARKQAELVDAQRAAKKKSSLDAIDFLQGVAQAKGYNLPDSVFQSLKNSWDFALPSAVDGVVKAPTPGFGSILLGALGQGASTYGSAALGNAVDRAGKYNAATALLGNTGGARTLPGLESTPGGGEDAWGGIADYWTNLKKLRPNGGGL